MSAHLDCPPELLLKAQGMRAVIFDVDGVMTDGGLYLSAQGEPVKRFHVLDGHGLRLLQQVGLVPVVITGRDSKALRGRLSSLGVHHACYGVQDKAAAASDVLAKLACDWAQCAVIGDDWPDLGLVTRCGFSAAPPGAHAEVLARVDYVTRRAAGQGAVREFCDVLLLAAGRYHALLREALA